MRIARRAAGGAQRRLTAAARATKPRAGAMGEGRVVSWDTERRYRWFEDDKLGATRRLNDRWWKRKAFDPEANWAKDVAQAKDHTLFEETLVTLPPAQVLDILQDENGEVVDVDSVESLKNVTMDSYIDSWIEQATSEDEKNYLRTFKGKDCRIGVDFFDADKWTELWRVVSEDVIKKRKEWKEDYSKRKQEKKKVRISKNDGVLGTLEKIFPPERAEQLWGPDWRSMNRKLYGFVMDKVGDTYKVIWAIPGGRFEPMVHYGDHDLETVYPEGYVPDFETFQYIPDRALAIDTWLQNCIIEHPLLIITESRHDPKLHEILEIFKEVSYTLLDLSNNAVALKDRQAIKDRIVELTNWPKFPQMFMSSMFLGGLENLSTLQDGGYLDTVMTMAGLKNPHPINREVNKYRTLVEAEISEWRNKFIEQVDAEQEQYRSNEMIAQQEGPQAVKEFMLRMDKKRPLMEKRAKIAAELKTGENTADIFYQYFRDQFLEESAREIERLKADINADRNMYLIPEDCPMNIETLNTIVNHRFFENTEVKSMVLQEIRAFMKSQNLVEENEQVDEDGSLVATAIKDPIAEYNIVEDSILADEIDRDTDIKRVLSEDDARSEIESADQSEDESALCVRLVQSLNEHMRLKWHNNRKRMFCSEFADVIGPVVTQKNLFDETLDDPLDDWEMGDNIEDNEPDRDIDYDGIDENSRNS